MLPTPLNPNSLRVSSQYLLILLCLENIGNGKMKGERYDCYLSSHVVSEETQHEIILLPEGRVRISCN